MRKTQQVMENKFGLQNLLTYIKIKSYGKHDVIV